jgi:hypothetical protein
MVVSTELSTEMALVKSTKGTHVYSNPDAATVTTVYVKKAALPTPPPQKITLSIDYERT